MSRRSSSIWLIAGALALASCNELAQPVGPGTAAEAPSFSRGTAMAGQHVFVMNGNRPSAPLAAAIEQAGGTVVYEMGNIGVLLTNGLSAAAARQLAQGSAQVANDASAIWVPGLSAPSFETLPSEALPLPSQSIQEPEAAFFYQAGLQWNMEITDTDDAWLQQFQGAPSVRVAILDTGLDPYHQDQAGLIDVASSRAFVPSTTGPPEWQDDHFHGTHVGGIVTSNNFGTAGVAPDVTLVAVKVLDSAGSGSVGAIIAGIYWAAEVGVDVINMSLGAEFPKSGDTALLVAAFNRAVNHAHSQGVYVVASAGNDARDLQHNRNFIAIPCETGVLSCISASGALDQPAYYTNYGTNAIDNAAPGGDILQRQPVPTGAILSLCTTRSANPALAACAADETVGAGINYVWAQGTSMAAPHVAGLGAYLDSQYGGSLNGSILRTRIQQSADDRGKPGADPYFGKGRINTCRTLPGCVPVPNPEP